MLFLIVFVFFKLLIDGNDYHVSRPFQGSQPPQPPGTTDAVFSPNAKWIFASRLHVQIWPQTATISLSSIPAPRDVGESQRWLVFPHVKTFSTCPAQIFVSSLCVWCEHSMRTRWATINSDMFLQESSTDHLKWSLKIWNNNQTHW